MTAELVPVTEAKPGARDVLSVVESHRRVSAVLRGMNGDQAANVGRYNQAARHRDDTERWILAAAGPELLRHVSEIAWLRNLLVVPGMRPGRIRRDLTAHRFAILRLLVELENSLGK